MKPAVKTSTDYFKPITGWNKAILTKIEEYKARDESVRTQAYFRFVGASEKSFEPITLTDKDNNADLDICNMIIEAFGGKAIKEGEDPTQVLNKCIGKECALLAFPQSDKRDGKTYMHTYYFGIIKGHKAVKPLAAVGELFNEEIGNTPKKEVKDQESLPSGW